MGRNTIREVLRHSPERILKAYVAESSSGSEERRQMIQSLEEHEIDIEHLSMSELTALVESESHQSFAAVLKPRPAIDLKEYLEASAGRERSLILMLDSIYDPQNLGALLRAAECFGADAVVWSRNRGADFSPAVSKASAGCSEIITTLQVGNLVEAIRRFKEAGYWVVASDVDTGAATLNSFDFPARCVLLMGSEGEGIQPLALRECDFRVYIEMFGRIDSLNVSQASAVFLSAYRRQHLPAGPARD
jgi:23S rRNA (guanosine2251-2'-O)-methyltransferase